MRSIPPLVVCVSLVVVLTACTTAAPTQRTRAPSETPTASVSLPLRDEADVEATAVPFGGTDGVNEITLWPQLPTGGSWTGDALAGSSAETSACHFTQSVSPASSEAPEHTPDDRDASAALLRELLAGRVPMQDARRVLWGSGTAFTAPESFDMLASLVDDDGFTVVGARVFARYDLSYRMELHCDELEPLARALDETADAVAIILHTDGIARAVPGELVGDYVVRIPTDLGARAHATGDAILDGDGIPVAYRVASDDVWDLVAKRFGLYGILPNPGALTFNIDTGYLNVINQVRRGDTPWVLYAGDTVNLSAYTVMSVGLVNGETLSGTTPDPLPAQR